MILCSLVTCCYRTILHLSLLYLSSYYAILFVNSVNFIKIRICLAGRAISFTSRKSKLRRPNSIFLLITPRLRFHSLLLIYTYVTDNPISNMEWTFFTKDIE